MSLGNEPVQLPLGKESVDEVESTERPNNRRERKGRVSVETRDDAFEREEGSCSNSREVPKLRLPDLESVDEPEVLRVPISVLVGPESVGNTLERVDDGASEIVGGVGEVLGSGGVKVKVSGEDISK